MHSRICLWDLSRTLPEYMQFTWQKIEVQKQSNKQTTPMIEKAFTEGILDVFCAILSIDHRQICKLSGCACWQLPVSDLDVSSDGVRASPAVHLVAVLTCMRMLC